MVYSLVQIAFAAGWPVPEPCGTLRRPERWGDSIRPFRDSAIAMLRPVDIEYAQGRPRICPQRCRRLLPVAAVVAEEFHSWYCWEAFHAPRQCAGRLRLVAE